MIRTCVHSPIALIASPDTHLQKYTHTLCKYLAGGSGGGESQGESLTSCYCDYLMSTGLGRNLMLSIFRQRGASEDAVQLIKKVNKYQLLLRNKVCVWKGYLLKSWVKNYFHIIINFDFDIMVISHEVISLLSHFHFAFVTIRDELFLLIIIILSQLLNHDVSREWDQMIFTFREFLFF